MLRATAFAAALWVTAGLSSFAFAQTPKGTERVSIRPAGQTAREQKIDNALVEPTALDVDESSLQDAVDYISQKHDIPVSLDNRALAEAAIDPSALVTFHVKEMPLGSALDLMLDDLDLTYVVQFQTLRITTREKAASVLTTRVYPIADLVKVAQPVSGARPRSNVGPVIQLIEDTILPDTWDTNAGKGSIKPFQAPGGMALVISTTRRAHEQIAQVLSDLRAVKQSAGDADKQGHDTQAPYRVMYDLGGVSGPEMVEAITSAVSPDTWKSKGGAGVISAVSTSVTENLAPREAKPDAPEPPRAIVKHWKLVVFQIDDVHRQIEDLLSPLSAKLGGHGCMNGMVY